MSHELTIRQNGTAEMAFVGETPWHRLGQNLKEGASIEEWQIAAGMDWSIRRSKAHFYTDRACTDLRAWDDQVVLYRSDNGQPLGIVSPDYNIVQPSEVLEFFRDLVSDEGFELHTAGTLFGGKRFWALAKVTEATIAGWDKIGGYLLLSTSADGSTATEARETSVRVVCRNTLSLAMNQRGTSKRTTVSHRVRFDDAKVKRELGLTREHFEQFIDAANALTKVKMNETAAENFLTRLLRPSKKLQQQITQQEGPTDAVQAAIEQEESEQSLRRPRGLDTILQLFQGAGEGAGKKGSAGTAWGLVNAVTEYVDHHATAKTFDHLMARSMFGDGDKLKTEAFNQALELA